MVCGGEVGGDDVWNGVNPDMSSRTFLHVRYADFDLMIWENDLSIKMIEAGKENECVIVPETDGMHVPLPFTLSQFG